MANLDSLIVEQELLIAALGRTLSNFKKIGQKNFTEAVARSRLHMLENQWEKCTVLNCQIENIATDLDRTTLRYFLQAVFLAAEDVFLAASDYLTTVVDKLKIVTQSASAPAIDLQSSIRQETQQRSLSLPSIAIPKFSGNYLDWTSFRDLFESLVANNDTLSNVQKLHYLKATLKDEAALLLKNVTVTDANYATAWKTLQTRFDNPRAIVTAHLTILFNIPSVKGESASELKRLRDAVNDSLSAMTNLGREVDRWDDLLVFLVLQRLDSGSRKDWELHLGEQSEFPKFGDLDKFLASRIRALEAISASQCSTRVTQVPNARPIRSSSTRSLLSTDCQVPCIVCNERHYLYRCINFKKLSVEKRLNIVCENHYCVNCLRKGHMSTNCPSKYRCARCKCTHHTLLHNDSQSRTTLDANSPSFDVNKTFNSHLQVASPTVPVELNHSCDSSTSKDQNTSSHNSRALDTSDAPQRTGFIILATAIVHLRSVEGRELRVRALIDPGSESTFVSEYVVQNLRAKKNRVHVEVSGVGGQTNGVARSIVTLILSPCQSRFPELNVTALVLSKLTTYRPPQNTHSLHWDHLRDLPFADDELTNPSPIDLLIGADLYGSILLEGLRKGPSGSPTAQLTIFGWILTGPTDQSQAPRSTVSLHCVPAPNLDALLTRFWEVEELPSLPLLSEEDKKCENHFASSHFRLPDGRYTVRLPFKNGPPIPIGSSYSIAFKLLQASERRLLRTPKLKQSYNEFLSEYLRLGHMELSSADSTIYSPVYLPHHPVIREESSTTRVRVVFNASSRTSNNTSLNEHLLSGPKLQKELPFIIMRWRRTRLVFSADIEKMFRQILVHSADADFQRILWRADPKMPVSEFRLLTVTYGTAAAPFLANRVLIQLAHDERSRFPMAASILEEETYVDDIFFGGDNVDEIEEQRHQLVSLLKCGGFSLRKWTSNEPTLLAGIAQSTEDATIVHPLNDDGSVKVLGIYWHPASDTFRFSLTKPEPATSTKRRVLSHIARLFDPLGWVSPVVIQAKILMQELWLRKGGWDEELPPDLLQKWQNYCLDLEVLSRLAIPRWTGQSHDSPNCEIHGFADASSRAYAAVVYLRVALSSSESRISLLISKTKVAPLKTLSIPKLELNAAFLLAKVVGAVLTQMRFSSIPIHCWSDSTVVLNWINQHPSRWKTFVANRVADIQTRLPQAIWHHVPTDHNPADCASRGISATELTSHPLWFSGPTWLQSNSSGWPNQVIISDLSTELERRALTVHSTGNPDVLEWDLPMRFSSWPKLLRVTAYIFRFVKRCRKRDSIDKQKSILSLKEIDSARTYWLLAVQLASFSDEIRTLQRGQSVSSRSRLASMNPFLDENGVLRVGGRLRNAPLQFDEKHPIILTTHPICTLIIAHMHLVCLHGGVQLTLRTLRQQFWVIGARTAVKKHIHRCIRCIRENAKTATQIMGDLPKLRVSPARPFLHCGVDYAGPFSIIPITGRGQKSFKAYVAVFVCFSTRAIHLELVTNYSSERFLAAFKRFVARRGLPLTVYSDNGTTFKGADRELTHAFRTLCRDPELAVLLASDGTQWHFIPPIAPHHGGLWEAGVKSVKHHLRRIIGSRTPSAEEFLTLLTQIEACLNSRPLAPLTDDPSDFTALTPGHFLIGAPLVSVPALSTLHLKENYLSRWQNIRRMLESFWRLWAHDYLNSLQQRQKWKSAKPNLGVNDLVLLRNPLLPPAKWELGRILAVHPGPDGCIRVVTVRTANSEFKRPITQICKLFSTDT